MRIDRSDGADGRAVGVGTGPERAGRRWQWFWLLAVVGLLWGAVDGFVAPSVPVAVVAASAVGAVVLRSVDPGDRRAALVTTAVLALAGVAAAVAWTPLANAPLPDIGVLGVYTYLATEVAFGALAAALLVRAGRGAVRRAARTVAVLYPLAYVWDWYTLEVGVFAIPLRTGVDLFGIPLEEHLFMVVVPALVLGVHEALVGLDRST